MADNKKHHYVPKFYLKLFSENNRSINIFNIPSKRSVLDGSLKNQCYRDYFYGKDLKTEKALSTLEGHMSRILRQIQFTSTIPSRNDSDYITFLINILIQYVRTAYSIDSYDEQINKLMKYLMAPEMEKLDLSLEQIANIKITQKNSAQWVLAMATPLYPLLMDLECKLIRATGSHEFITSDNPIVCYNQLLSFRNLGGNTGLASKGLKIFFPIGPKLLVLLYDSRVYGVGSKKCNVVDVSSAQDIEQLNRLQYVSALENVYYRSKFFPILSTSHSADGYRRSEKARMQVFQGQEEADYRKDLLVMSREDVRTELELSFLRLLKPAKEWRRNFQTMNPQPSVIVRNSPLIKMHEDFIKLVKAKQYKHNDFFKYVNETSRNRSNYSASS